MKKSTAVKSRKVMPNPYDYDRRNENYKPAYLEKE